eukprot:jgi/Chlat1/3898/Chrsp26S08863
MATAAAGGEDARSLHNARQSKYFDAAVEYFTQPIPQEVVDRLHQIVGAAKLTQSARVLDVGSGVGPLIPIIGAPDCCTGTWQTAADRGCSKAKAAGVPQDQIVAVDLSEAMLVENKTLHDDVSCWIGDVADLPKEYGPFDAVFINACFGNFYDQAAALADIVSLCNPGAAIVISHPLGHRYVEQLHQESPDLVPNSLPHSNALDELATPLGLQVESLTDEEDLYLALLRVNADHVPDHRLGSSELQPSQIDDLSNPSAELAGALYLDKAPVYLRGPVVSGFGRGSKQMGIPTANLPPEQLQEELEGIQLGVYFGWAALAEGNDQPHKMVMNVGKRPTFVDGEGITVELHIMHKYPSDFYGKELRAVVLGFVRGEQKFSSIGELIARIHKDIEVADAALDRPMWSVYHQDPFFYQKT